MRLPKSKEWFKEHTIYVGKRKYCYVFVDRSVDADGISIYTYNVYRRFFGFYWYPVYTCEYENEKQCKDACIKYINKLIIKSNTNE